MSLAVLAGAIATATLPLSQLFLLWIIVLAVVLYLAIASALFALSRLLPRPVALLAIPKGVRYRAPASGLFLIVGCVGLATMSFLPSEEGAQQIGMLDGERTNHFTFVGQEALSPSEFLTLGLELERAYARIAPQWKLAPHEPLEVRIYEGREDYLRLPLTSPDSIGAMQCSQDGARVHLYLEHGILSNAGYVNSRTIHHEVAHSIMCMALGAEAFHALPLWVHEGYARSMELQGMSRWWAAAMNRLDVWTERASLPSSTHFCAAHAGTHHEHSAGVFYSAAWEFLRFMNAQREHSVIHSIAWMVADGADANSAVTEVLGGSCEEAYHKWVETFLPRG